MLYVVVPFDVFLAPEENLSARGESELWRVHDKMVCDYSGVV